MSPSPGAAPVTQPPNYKTCVLSANYEPISTKFSGISTPTRWQGIGKKMLKNATPSWGCPTSHILKYCQLLDICGNYERISMKTVIKKFQQQTSGKEEWREGQSGNMSPPLGGGHSRLSRLSPRPAYGMCVGL